MLLRWYRELVAAKYDGSARRGAGRPRVSGEIRDLVIRMAIENRGRGCTRIQGALSNLGLTVGRNPIRRILAENGLDPAGPRSTTWSAFLMAHWSAIAAMDFFSVEVVTWRGLVRQMVLFVIDLKTRRIEIAGIIAVPNGLWISQIARNLTNCDDGFFRDQHYVIHDRDPLFTKQFRTNILDVGTEPIRLPSKSPNLNAYAKRFVRSIESEWLGQIIPLGEPHLRSLVRDYAEHYHHVRNHQGIGNRIIAPRAGDIDGRGKVRCTERIGGLLRFYSRAA